MNLFTLSDMHYTQATNQTSVDGIVRMNYKGLLATNPDRTIAHAKPAYHGAQTVFAIFDETVLRIAEYPFTTTSLRSLSVSGYRHPRGQIAAYWFNDAPPAEGNGVTRAALTLPSGKFTEPVLVDVRTSTVYALPAQTWTTTAGGTTFRALPFYDSPLLLAERAAITIAR